MSTEKSGGSKSMFALIVIPCAIAIGYLFYLKFLGAGSHFEEGNPEKKSLDMWGDVYKGGIAIVPILIGCFLLVLTFTFERFFTIMKAKGKGSVEGFIRKIYRNSSPGCSIRTCKIC